MSSRCTKLSEMGCPLGAWVVVVAAMVIVDCHSFYRHRGAFVLRVVMYFLFYLYNC